jgi:hypothetical protein
MMKICKCPMCHGEGGWWEPVLWRGIGGGPYEVCDLCLGVGKVSQDLRMKWVRSFKNDH